LIDLPAHDGAPAPVTRPALAGRRQVSRVRLALAATLACAALTVLAAPPAMAGTKPPPPILNVAYGSLEKQVTDIYPQPSGEAPAVVLVHESGWMSGDKTTTALHAAQLQKAGFVVFNINYRLDSPSVPAFPMEVEDVEAATRFAVAHAAEYHGNPLNVMFVGGSSGGHLAAVAAERLNASTANTASAVVTLSAPTNLQQLLQDAKEKRLSASLAKAVRQALGCATPTACETPAKQAFAVEWSPADQLATPCVPWLVFNSQQEIVPLDQPTALVTHLEQEGCPVTETIVPGNKHAFAYWSTVFTQVTAFLHSN
jgi:acetyl esterase/lipase